jgi:hypothetical protein
MDIDRSTYAQHIIPPPYCQLLHQYIRCTHIHHILVCRASTGIYYFYQAFSYSLFYQRYSHMIIYGCVLTTISFVWLLFLVRSLYIYKYNDWIYIRIILIGLSLKKSSYNNFKMLVFAEKHFYFASSMPSVERLKQLHPFLMISNFSFDFY